MQPTLFLNFSLVRLSLFQNDANMKQNVLSQIILDNNFIMWNLYPASKIIDNRIRQKSYQLHQEKLAKMKPKIKIEPPQQPDFVYTKNKLEMSRRDRLIEIDYQNQILLNKMNSISTAQYHTNKLRPEAQQLKTLNRHIVNLQAEDIYNQNRRICQKLLRINSHYPTFQIIDHTQQLQKFRTNISENARRAHSVANLHRPQSSITRTSAKFYRSRVNKFDAAGNSCQQKTLKLFQMQSQSKLRPQSAPFNARTHVRPYSSEKPEVRPRKTLGDNVQEGFVQGHKFSQS